MLARSRLSAMFLGGLVLLVGAAGVAGAQGVPDKLGTNTIVRNVTRTAGDTGPTVVITMQGVASRPPDVAYVNLGILTNDDVSTAAVAKNNAIFDALQAKLAPLGVDAAKVKTTFYNVSYAARPTAAPQPAQQFPIPQSRYGYNVSRQLQLTVTVGKVGDIVDAAIAAGATTVSNVQYALADASAAYNDALASALKSARSQAEAVAQASGMHLGGVKQIQVQQQNFLPTPVPMRPQQGAVASGTTLVAPATVDTRASVTVTYLLKP